MHDLNNVLHLIGTGVYHASTQLGEEREWAYGFCEMLSSNPRGWVCLFCCRDFSHHPLMTQDFIWGHVPKVDLPQRFIHRPMVWSAFEYYVRVGWPANTWIARWWKINVLLFESHALATKILASPPFRATNRSDIIFLFFGMTAFPAQFHASAFSTRKGSGVFHCPPKFLVHLSFVRPKNLTEPTISNVWLLQQILEELFYFWITHSNIRIVAYASFSCVAKMVFASHKFHLHNGKKIL